MIARAAHGRRALRAAVLVATVLASASTAGQAFAVGGPAGQVVEFKVAEPAGLHVRGGRLLDESDSPVVPALDGATGSGVSRVFQRDASALASERRAAHEHSGRRLPDLTSWYRVQLDPGASSDAVIDAIRRTPGVEQADLVPSAAPLPTTPSFLEAQGYLGAAPDGIGASSVAAVPGSGGDRVRVADLEYAWNTSHEDLGRARLPGSQILNGTPADPFASTDHGTAVLGELVGDDNGFGVTGIVPRATPELVNVVSTERGLAISDAISLAQGAMQPGDIILIEQQMRGPGSELLPVEWLPSTYDAITAATAAGLIVVEAAANGGINLDDPLYGKSFPMGKPDSGAIMVGAGAAPCDLLLPARSRLGFSDYGRRIDLQGWGECVTTTGYGQLYKSDLVGATDWYTAQFNGTSSASAIVAGAAASFASAYEQANGVAPAPARVRRVLADTGTKPGSRVTGTGPQPNLARALTAKNLRAR